VNQPEIAAPDVEPARRATARIRLSGVADDRTLLKAAAELTRDIQQPKPLLYWSDFLASAAAGYAALAGAILSRSAPIALVCGATAILALYRATLFIHEITHLQNGKLPGFRMAWNLVIGMPTLLPSFLYEGIHIIHHNRTRYGTVDDPEYLPLALMRPWTLPVFLILSVLMPAALLVRFAILAPLSLFSPRLRQVLVARFSGLQINPRFRRRTPEGAFARQWLWQELGASVVGVTVLGSLASGLLPVRAFLIAMGVLAGVAVLNQVRTLVAHLWENDGAPLTITAQFLDSTNVPQGFLPLLWAPVGLRFHALHHLLPSLPYHSLAEADRRLSRALGRGSVYERASYPTLRRLVGRLASTTMKRPRHRV
jgi:fatty acid desaturase